MTNKPAAKASASATQTVVQMAASVGRTSCASRWNTPRSRASIASTNAMKPTQNQMLVGIMTRGKLPEDHGHRLAYAASPKRRFVLAFERLAPEPCRGTGPASIIAPYDA